MTAAEQLYNRPIILKGGYQVCEGCGKVMVSGEAAYYRETTNGKYYVHQNTRCLDGDANFDPRKSHTIEGGLNYLSFKDHVERELLPHSTAEMYGDESHA